MKIKPFFLLFIPLFLALFFLTGCSPEENPISPNIIQEENTSNPDEIPESVEVSEATIPKIEDLKVSESSTKITTVQFNNTSISIDGTGATAKGSVLTVTKAGTYEIKGTLTNGQIMINATEEDTIQLILNGVTITNQTGAPIYAASCDKLVITLAEGSRNSVTDGGKNFIYTNAADEEPNAAIFSKGDLTINGTGALTVHANFHNGISSKDDLLIVNGNITVDAANHGIRGKDSVSILDGSFQIAAGGDGIQSSNDQDKQKGWVAIKGGDFNITTANDGIQAETSLNISGGNFIIQSGNDSSSSSESFKGIKAGTDVLLSTASLTITSADDAIHSNGNITIQNGSFILSSGDDGIHADKNLTIAGGNINILKSYEGIEGANVSITGGTIKIVSTDDGINAAGGADQNMSGGRFGRDQFASSNSYSIHVSGGTISLLAGGDGLDSNGTINISGGTIVSLIQSTPDNGALDADGTVTITGGIVIYGGTGTGSNPGGNSTQSYVYINSTIQSEKEISVKKDGKTIIQFTPSIDCKYLALSSPDIKSGASYEIYSGTTLLNTATAGTGGSGMMGGRGGLGDGGMRMPRN